ncbi:hypothetical protein JTY60_00485 [symbiont of Argiope bruennichi]|uniref:hypothetical protein n=1 Tax=symbiont of Argiope bruennichi TaxID=2810479 RepID=UPI003DA24FD7
MKRIKFIFYKSIRFFKNIYVILLLFFFAILFSLVGYYRFFYHKENLNFLNIKNNYYLNLAKKLKINIKENNLSNTDIKNIIIKKTKKLNFWLKNFETIYLYNNSIYVDSDKKICINKDNFSWNLQKLIENHFYELTENYFLKVNSNNKSYLKINFGFFLFDNSFFTKEKPLKITFNKKFVINK